MRFCNKDFNSHKKLNSCYLVSFKCNLLLNIYRDDSFISLSRMEFEEEVPLCLNSKMVTKGPTSALMVYCFSRKIMTVGIFLHMDCVENRSINNKNIFYNKSSFQGFL